MAVMRYVALLRGINVGGKNKIPMGELRDTLEQVGCTDVESYIQSGQVVFASTIQGAALEAVLEEAIAERFALSIPVVVKSHATLRSIVEDAPVGFGQSPDIYHYDVIFLKRPMTPAGAMEVVRLRDGVDQVWPGDDVLYFSRLSEKRSRSLMSTIIRTPAYKLMTIRNWNTTTKLRSMLDAAGQDQCRD